MKLISKQAPTVVRHVSRSLHRRRSAALIALVGALAFALPAAANASGPSYVSMGDSYTAAPGVQPMDGFFFLCFQSSNNYPHLVAADLGLSLTDVSCSGAKTENFTKSQYEEFGLAPQFDALSPTTEVVTVGMGGNDGNLFGTLLKRCTELDHGQPPKADPCKENEEAFVQKTREEFQPLQEEALREIHVLSPNAKVFLVGYPDITPANGYCPEVMPWTTADMRWFRNGVQIPGNESLKEEAANTGAVFVNTFPKSIGHDVCQPVGVRWIEPLEHSLTGVPVHPNAMGEEQDALRVEKAMEQNGIK